MTPTYLRRAAAGAATLALLVVPAAGLAGKAHIAKAHKVTMKLDGKLTGITIKGTAKGKPFGNCKNKAKLVIPNTQQVWTCPKGKVYLTGHGTTGAANKAHGTWKITKGTGKFKGAKGHGVFDGLQSTGKFTYKGTASY